MASTSAGGTCTGCGKSAKLACQGCLNGVDVEGNIAPKRMYCSVDCQTKDWPSHSTDCKKLKTRKGLYRAGKFFQDVFFAYEQWAFAIPLHGIERLPDGNLETIHVHDAFGQKPSDKWRAAMKDPDIKKAVLAWYSRGDGLLYLSNLLAKAINGITSNIEGTQVIMRLRSPLTITYHYQEEGEEVTETNMWEPHNILKIKLRNGAGVFAFDFAGSQYGRFDAVVPWDDYLDTLGPSQEDLEAAIRSKQDSLAGMFLELLETFMNRQDITLDSLLGLTDKAFEEKHRALITSLQLGWIAYDLAFDSVDDEASNSVRALARETAKARAKKEEEGPAQPRTSYILETSTLRELANLKVKY